MAWCSVTAPGQLYLAVESVAAAGRCLIGLLKMKAVLSHFVNPSNSANYITLKSLAF
jgi:hypothetical protein